MREENAAYLMIAIVIVSLGAWITHILHCLIHAKYLLLITGAFMFPVGIIHGVGIWLGVSW
jgi:hypothetical protein